MKAEKLELGICLYAVDWCDVFQIEELNKYVDMYFLMAYDYYYAGSKTAGPVAPIASKGEWLPYNIEKSVKAYLDKGVSADKLIVSLPYYGRKWKTANNEIPSKNIKAISAPCLKEIAKMELKNTKDDHQSDTKIGLSLENENNYQLWFDDTTTLAKKYDWIIDNSLAGVGIWALGYDNGLNGYWELLGKKFGRK